MPRFLDVGRRLLLSTSRKVLYSTLRHHEHLRELNELQAAAAVARGAVDRHILLVRDPYNRLISAWSSKFVKDPVNKHRPGSNKPWQPIHRMILPHLGVRSGAGDDEIRDALTAVTFERLVHLLDRVHRQDGHLTPQWRLLRVRPWDRLPLFAVSVDEVVRMERPDLADYCAGFGLQLKTIHRNPSRHGTAEELYTPELAAVVERIYARDFELFGYGRLELRAAAAAASSS